MQKLTPNSQRFVNSIISNCSGKSPEMSVLLGYAIAMELALPSEPTTSIEAYYSRTYGTDSPVSLRKVVELFPIKIDEVKEMVSSFYAWRYSIYTGNIAAWTIEADLSSNARLLGMPYYLSVDTCKRIDSVDADTADRVILLVRELSND